MYNCNCNQGTMRLPDVFMVAGDTTPWVVSLVTDKGRPFSDIPDNTVAKLTMTDMNDIDITKTVLSIESNDFYQSAAGGTIIRFDLSIADTSELGGKYVYQIALTNGTQQRVAQGVVTIKKNNDVEVATL